MLDRISSSQELPRSPSQRWRSAVAVCVALLLLPFLGPDNVGLVFLTSVVGVAVQFGLWPSLFASVGSSLCYNFFFTAPYYTFAIDEPKDIVAVLFFTVVAIIVSNVAARARAEANVARARSAHDRVALRLQPQARGRRHARRCALGFSLSGGPDAEHAGRLAAARERQCFPCVRAIPPEDRLDEPDLAAAQWAWENSQPAGRGADTLPECPAALPTDAHGASRHRRHRSG